MSTILLIDESRSRAADLCAGLVQAGHKVAAVLPSVHRFVPISSLSKRILPRVTRWSIWR